MVISEIELSDTKKLKIHLDNVNGIRFGHIRIWVRNNPYDILKPSTRGFGFDLKYLEELFTEDAAFDSPNGMLKTTGRQNIIDMYTEVFQSRGPSFHWTHDIRIKLNNEDTSKATGTVYSHAETTRDGVPSLAAMRYDDEYSNNCLLYTSDAADE